MKKSKPCPSERDGKGLSERLLTAGNRPEYSKERVQRPVETARICSLGRRHGGEGSYYFPLFHKRVSGSFCPTDQQQQMGCEQQPHARKVRSGDRPGNQDQIRRGERLSEMRKPCGGPPQLPERKEVRTASILPTIHIVFPNIA